MFESYEAEVALQRLPLTGNCLLYYTYRGKLYY